MRDFLDEPIHEAIHIRAPIERCFALSTRIELVQRTLGMKLIGDLTTGHITANSRVTWQGWKFGLPTTHHTLITAFEPPHTLTSGKTAFFQDTQERGRFAFFQHDHHFHEEMLTNTPITTLRDEIRFALPFGPLGRLAANCLLAPHIRKLAHQRFALIKQLAETDAWREWLQP